MSFDEEIVKHMRHLRGYAMRLTRNVDAAEDLVQSTMERALKNRASYTSDRNLRGWLYVVMANIFRSGLRTNRLVLVGDDAVFENLVSTEDQARGLEAKEALRRLQQMSPKYRDVLLAAGNGCSYDEMAAEFGIAVGSVKSRLSRARSLFQEAIQSRQPIGA